jgi:hypothetical protein
MKFLILILCCVSCIGYCDEKKVLIRLKDGTVIKGSLSEFGTRTFRIKIGEQWLNISENQVNQIDYAPGDADVSAKQDRVDTKIETKESKEQKVDEQNKNDTGHRVYHRRFSSDANDRGI